MIYLGEDHFAVADIVYDLRISPGYNENYIINKDYVVANSEIKWGIIKLNRDMINKIIPKGESLIVPYIYDSIEPNNNKTATASYKKKFTYIELNRNSENYGKQLLPCILDRAMHYDITHKDLAEVTIKNTTGFIPRNICLEALSEMFLLSDEEAEKISKYINNEIVNLNSDTSYKYLALTGEMPTLTRVLKNKNKN